MESDIKGKNILVTGASRGIGKAISKAVAAAGANVIMAARDEKALSNLREEIISNNGKAIYLPTDLTNEEDIKALFKKVENDYGTLDVLINNASKIHEKGGGKVNKGSITIPVMSLILNPFSCIFLETLSTS